MPLQHHIAPGWILLQEDDGSVYLLEDIRNLPEAGGEEAKHSPFATVQAARSWLEDEFADLAAVATEEQSRQTH